ncbi:alpha/beta hydrolase [Marimonas lutisalis]|uniref:alpha/beta hydrolase n=1 Tax=Marimonas lutisalis TaxID=2545756 RepID=UPI0010F8DC90|nr:alpha/beta hydrolase [Marimonas lutisalis]
MAYPGLDPTLVPVVAELQAAFPTPPDELGHQEWRRLMAERSAAMPKTRPEGMAVEDLVFETPFGPVGARMYRPAGLPDPAPCVIYMHGGGWIMGDLNSHDGVCVDLALQVGAVVIALDYGLAPETPYPGALNQCHWVYHHLRETAAARGINPGCMAIAGDSAGGNLTLAVCMKTQAEGGALPRAQLLIYPCVSKNLESASYVEHAEAPFLDKRGMVWIWDTYLQSPENWGDPLALPELAESYARLPPAVVFTAALDPLCSEGDALAQRFVEDGVPVLHGRAEGLIHGFIRFRGVSPPSEAAFQRMTAGLRMFLGL